MHIPEGFVKIGEVCVDSGQLMIIDPCYLHDWKDGEFFLDKNNEGIPTEELPPEKFNHYHEACLATCSKEMCGEVLNGLGVVFGSGWGDGTYNVYAWRECGRIMAVLVLMQEEYNTDDEDDEGEGLWEENEESNES